MTAADDARGLDERFARALAHSQGRVSMLVDLDGVILRITPSVQKLLGYEPAELAGTLLFDLYDETQGNYSRAGFKNIRAHPELDAEQHGIVSRTGRVRHRNGTWLSVDTFASPMLHLADVSAVLIEWFPVFDPGRLIAAMDSLAQGRPAEETLLAAVRLTESLVRELHGGVVSVHGDGWQAEVTPAGCDARGMIATLPPPASPGWSQPWMRLPDEDTRPWAIPGHAVAAIPLRSTAGELLGAFVATRRRLDVTFPVLTSAESLVAVALRMVTLTLNQSRVHEALREAAEVDALTGLLNRAGLERAVTELTARRPGLDIAVVFMDLDDFKLVNDSLGHAAGDQLLIATADALRRSSRPTDLISRLGGDEFVMIAPLESDDVAAVAGALASRLHEELNRLPEAAGVDSSGRRIAAGASAGVSWGQVSDLPWLLQEADQALYAAKRDGKHKIVLRGP